MAALAACHCQPALAQPFTWTATTSGVWSVGTNWDGSIAPPSGSDLAFGGSGSSGYTATLDYGSASDASKFFFHHILLNSSSTATNTIDALGGRMLVFNSPSGSAATAITQSGSGAFTIAAALENNYSSKLNISGNGTGLLTISGAINASGQSNVGLRKTGSHTLALTGTNNFTGDIDVFGGVLQIASHTNLRTGSVTVNLDNGGTIRLAGNVTFQNAASFSSLAGGGVIDTQGFALARLNGGVGIAGSTTLTGGGTVYLSSSGAGTVTVDGAATLFLVPASNVNSGATLAVGGATLRNSDESTPMTVTRNVTVGAGGVTIVTNGTGNILTYSGVIGGTGPVTVTSAITGINNVTFSGNNTASGTLTVADAAVLTLTGNNAAGSAFAGGIVIDGTGSAVKFTADTQLGAAGVPITLSNGGAIQPTTTLTHNRPLVVTGFGAVSPTTFGSTYTLAGNVSGGGRLDLGGPVTGTIIVTGNNSGLTGGLRVVTTAQVDSDVRLGAATAPLEVIGTLQATGSFASTRPVTLGSSNASTINTGAFDLTLSGPISVGRLRKTGTGTLTLTGANTFGSGVNGLRVEAGTLRAGADSALGGPAANLILVGGMFQPTASFTLGRQVDVQSSAGGVFVPAGVNLGISGKVTGSSSSEFVKSGAGTLSVFGTTNTYAGGTRVSGGVLEIVGNGSLGDPISGTTGLTLDGGATLRLLAPTDLTLNSRPLTVAGGGTIDTFGHAVTISAVVGGAGDLTVTGGGTLTLTNSNTLTGTVTIGPGTVLDAFGASSLGTTAPVRFAGGTLHSSGTSVTSGRTFTVQSGSDYRFSGGAQVTTALADQAGGGPAWLVLTTPSAGSTFTLQAANTFTGPTIVTSAKLVLSSGGGLLGTSGITLTSGNLFNPNFTAELTVTQTGIGARLAAGAGLSMNGAALRLNGPAGGTAAESLGTLTVGAGANTITLNPASGHSADLAFTTFVNGGPAAGASLLVRGPNLGAAAAPFSRVRFTGGLGTDLIPGVVGDTSITGLGGFFVRHDATLGLVPATTATVSGITAATSGHVVVNAQISAQTGAAVLQSLAVVTAGGASLSQNGHALTLESGHLLRNNTTNTSGLTISGGTLTTGGAAPLTVFAATDLTITSAVAASTTGGLIKLGPAVLTLGGTNSYAGTTVVGGGVLKVGSSGALPAGADVTVAGGNFDLNGFSPSLGTVRLQAGAISNSSATAIALVATTFEQTGGSLLVPLGGSSALAVNAPGGTATLSAAASFTGGTTVQAGTAVVTVNGALGSTAGQPAVVTSGATLQLGTGSGGLSYSSAMPLQIAGTGAAGTGALVNAGGSSTYAGPITLTADATIYNPAGATLNLSGPVTKNGNVLTLAGGGTVLINGQVVGASPNSDLVVENGTAAQLNVASNYNGPTVVRGGGTLTLGGTDVLPAGQTLVLGGPAGGGTLNLNGFNHTVGGLATGGAGVANRVVNSGAGSPTLTVNQATDLTFAGQLGGGTVAAPAQQNFGLTKDGAGTLTLSGPGTYSGPTAVDGGTLVVNGPILSNVTVDSGVLKGTGSTSGTLTVKAGGVVAPGNSPGTFTAGATTFEADSVFNVELAGAQDADGQRDQLVVLGVLNVLPGAVVHVDQFASPTFEFGSTYTYTIARAAGPVQVGGSDTGNLSAIEITSGFAAPEMFSLSRNGNALVLTFTPVPEPAAALAVLATGLGAAGWWRRRAGR